MEDVVAVATIVFSASKCHSLMYVSIGTRSSQEGLQYEVYVRTTRLVVLGSAIASGQM